MRRAAVIGAGSWGTAVAVLLARGGLEVQLGTRTADQAARDGRGAGRTSATCQGVRLPDSLQVKRASEIELAGLDLICLAVPSAALPQAVGAIADRVGERSAILLLSKGLVAPQGELPSEYVGERVRARAIACLGGPAHAREAVSGSAALVLGSADADLRAQLGEVFDRAGLVCERSDDVVGVEMAGAAKNAAALAAAAAAAPRPQRGRDRRRPRSGASASTTRLKRGAQPRDLRRPGRGRRPDGDRDGARQPQPPRRRAARRRDPGRSRSRPRSARPRRASTRCR